ncbi:MAG: recombinase family protein [Clostridia bacterium]|nr:recombinase family protein [Clostridia bacterium]
MTLAPSPYRTALYCRLSKDDEQIGESTSIETQRLMLNRFCQENQLAIVDYYVDDGFSGLSYDRLQKNERTKSHLTKFHPACRFRHVGHRKTASHL